MSHLISAIQQGYYVFNVKWSDPRTKDYPLVSSPFPILGIILLYQLFIHKVGPALMKNRHPFNLDKLLIVFNGIQILLSSYLCVQATWLTVWELKYNFICQEIEQDESPPAKKLLFLVWLYFFTKLLDLLDTVFFILRKKHNQVSFLHVYHHTGMTILGWVGIKFVPGGQSILTGIINSFVHAVMYTYYLTSVFSPEKTRSTIWKKSITQLQMIQFSLLGLHYVTCTLSPSCEFPKLLCGLLLPNVVFIVMLFWDFYQKSYSNLKKEL